MYFIRTDHIGRPVFATDSTGAKVWEAMYLPFGGVHTTTNTPVKLRFPGQWFQSESGLHQNWMRDYDPTTGRYMQADPLGLVDGASVYGYALQNPGRYSDPRGEMVFSTVQSIHCRIFECTPKPEMCELEFNILLPNFGMPDFSLPPGVNSGGGETPEATPPAGVPPEFEKESESPESGAEVWVNPENPIGDRIRVMPGNPNSPFPGQRGPYAKVTKGGRVVGADGKPISGSKPSKSPESHIPIDKLPDIFK